MSGTHLIRVISVIRAVRLLGLIRVIVSLGLLDQLYTANASSNPKSASGVVVVSQKVTFPFSRARLRRAGLVSLLGDFAGDSLSSDGAEAPEVGMKKGDVRSGAYCEM